MSNTPQEKIYLLESVNLTLRRGVLKIKNTTKGSRFKTFHVTLSVSLSNHIRNEWHTKLKSGDRFVGTEFKSLVNSKEFKENPFCLKHFVPIEGSDIPENYLLELVDERKPRLVTGLIDALGDRYDEYKDVRARAKNFKRYIQRESNKMMSDTRLQVSKTKNAIYVVRVPKV